MEVHHHSHTARNKWTHYFWEFMMLFLAVFCGFLAEYQLEHKIEKDRSRQYISSFYDDLNINLSTLSRIASNNEKKLFAFDPMFLCYDSLMENKKPPACFTGMLKQSMYFFTVAFADGTLGQLKNAGGLRLLNKEDRDSIISYDNMIRNYREWEGTAMQQSQDNVRNSFDIIGHFQANKFLYTDSIPGENIPVMFATDNASINNMFNVLFRYQHSIKRQTKWLTDIKARTNSLLKYFKSKYHFQ